MRRFVVLGLVGALAFSFVGSPASRAATLSSSWPVRQQPFGLAVDEQTGKVYVANSGTVVFDINDPSAAHGVVSVIDPVTGFVERILTSHTANWVLVDAAARRLYSSNAALSGPGRSVDVFDIDSGASIASIPVGGLGMALDPVAGRLYVCEGSSLRVIDTTSFAVLNTVPAPTSAVWSGVAADPERHQLYVTNLRETAPSFFLVDDRDLSVVEIPFAMPTRFAVAVDPVSHLVFAAGGRWNGLAFTSALSVIDPDTRRVVHDTALPGLALGIALAPSRHLVYVSDNDGRRLYAVDDSTFEVVETISLAFPPGELAMHPDGRLFVGSYDNRSTADSAVIAVDPANHAPVIESFAVSPSTARTNDTLTASVVAFDPDLRPTGAADPTTLAYEWLRNGAPIVGATGSTLDLKVRDNGDRGDTITVRVTASDGQLSNAESRSVIIEDTPQAVSLEVSNPTPRTNEDLVATVVVVDPDPDGGAYRCVLAYSVNSVLLFEVPACRYTYSLSVHDYGDKDDVISIRATVTEQFGRWQSVATATAVVADSAPVIAGLALSDPTPASRDVLVATVSTYDVDGDVITLAYEWTVNGVSRQIATSSATTDSFDLGPKGNGDNGDAVTVSVLASDGTLTSSTWSASATVTPGRRR
jgi:DNA-binding beta-propeller fold protein YncE